MAIFSKYVIIKQICSALYFNAGVIISSLIFIFADPATLELGKVFSTIALLGYVFNFSVLYSNYAIEALYSLIVFNKRVDQVVVQTQNFVKRLDQSEDEKYSKKSGLAPSLHLQDVTAVWSTSDYALTGRSVIKDISFKFDNFEKVAVIGRVGSGKSTLFNALLKEAYVVSGSVEIKGSSLIGYAEQSPVIVTGTVRSNILYGSNYDK